MEPYEDEAVIELRRQKQEFLKNKYHIHHYLSKNTKWNLMKMKLLSN